MRDADARIVNGRHLVMPIVPLIDQSHCDLLRQLVAPLAVERAGDIGRVITHAIEHDQGRAPAGLPTVPGVIGAGPAQIKQQRRSLLRRIVSRCRKV